MRRSLQPAIDPREGLRDFFGELLQLARIVPPEHVAAFLGHLRLAEASVLARIAAPPAVERPDENLDVAETARRMRVSKAYLYRNHQRFAFTRREGRKLLFSSAGLDLYLKKSR